MPRGETSLATRVATGTALAAGLAALLSAVSALVVSDRLVLAAEDERLRAAASIAVREIGDASDTHEIDEELAEVAPEGISLAVFSNGARVRGDGALPRIDAGTCAFRGDEEHRACAAGTDALQIVVAMKLPPKRRGALVAACGLAVVLSAVVAALLGRRTARWALAPLTRLRGSLAGLTEADPRAIAADDTTVEVAALRRALTDLVTRLATSLDAARRFSADAAHELKTPLTVLRAELELLGEEPLAPGVRATVEKLAVRVEALAKLVERLLALANAPDRAKLAEDAVAIEDVVRDAVARLGDPARARVTVHAAGPGMVLGDETLLGAIVENAIDNALKFSSGAVEITVTEGEQIVLAVCDCGPGIPPADRARAFEAFFRTPASRASGLPGHGIGLALVAQIAAAHGGAAELVDPPAGPGVCLRVTLPVWRRV